MKSPVNWSSKKEREHRAPISKWKKLSPVILREIKLLKNKKKTINKFMTTNLTLPIK